MEIKRGSCQEDGNLNWDSQENPIQYVHTFTKQLQLKLKTKQQ